MVSSRKKLKLQEQAGLFALLTGTCLGVWVWEIWPGEPFFSLMLGASVGLLAFCNLVLRGNE